MPSTNNNYPAQLIRQCLEAAKFEMDGGRSGWSTRVSMAFRVPRDILLGWIRKYDGDPAKVSADENHSTEERIKVRKKYTHEFIKEAIRKFENRGDKPITEISRELEVHPSNLQRWMRSKNLENGGEPASKLSREPKAPIKKEKSNGRKVNWEVRGEEILMEASVTIPVSRYCDLLVAENKALRAELGRAS